MIVEDAEGENRESRESGFQIAVEQTEQQSPLSNRKKFQTAEK